MYLSVAHKKMLAEDSDISEEVIDARGYRTVDKKADLRRLGFSDTQCSTPGLLIPIYSPTGEKILYQFRPDEPRIRDGKIVKYETPRGSTLTLDVHPFARGKLGDPSTPLFVTKGIKKGDALVSQGLCAAALLGVWSWRGTNPWGGKVALPEWEYVARNDREIYVVFDSDIMLKPEVHAAMLRLKAFLEGGSVTEVRIIYLPPGEGGRKQGVDDYLAAGHTVTALLAHATTELREPPRGEGEDPIADVPYRNTRSGLVYDKPTQDGSTPVPLTNFTARIVADVARDDGAEVQRAFEIQTRLNNRHKRFSVPAAKFSGMGWPTEHLGASAIVYPGFSVKDHARAAIQMLSEEIEERRVFTHTGWRKIDGVWVYLHGGGTIGPAEGTEGFEVQLDESLSLYAQPESSEGEALKKAIRASLGIWEMAPDELVIPQHAGTFRAAMGESDFSTLPGKPARASLNSRHSASNTTVQVSTRGT